VSPPRRRRPSSGAGRFLRWQCADRVRSDDRCGCRTTRCGKGAIREAARCHCGKREPLRFARAKADGRRAARTIPQVPRAATCVTFPPARRGDRPTRVPDSRCGGWTRPPDARTVPHPQARDVGDEKAGRPPVGSRPAVRPLPQRRAAPTQALAGARGTPCRSSMSMASTPSSVSCSRSASASASSAARCVVRISRVRA
jgi:hypothetical protein